MSASRRILPALALLAAVALTGCSVEVTSTGSASPHSTPVDAVPIGTSPSPNAPFDCDVVASADAVSAVIGKKVELRNLPALEGGQGGLAAQEFDVLRAGGIVCEWSNAASADAYSDAVTDTATLRLFTVPDAAVPSDFTPEPVTQDSDGSIPIDGSPEAGCSGGECTWLHHSIGLWSWVAMSNEASMPTAAQRTAFLALAKSMASLVDGYRLGTAGLTLTPACSDVATASLLGTALGTPMRAEDGGDDDGSVMPYLPRLTTAAAYCSWSPVTAKAAPTVSIIVARGSGWAFPPAMTTGTAVQVGRAAGRLICSKAFGCSVDFSVNGDWIEVGAGNDGTVSAAAQTAAVLKVARAWVSSQPL